MSVPELADQWVAAETWGACQYDRAEQILRAADGHSQAWERFADDAR